MKTRSILMVAALLVAAAACRKGPEQTASAQTQNAAPQPPAPPKPMPAELPDVLARVNGQPVTKVDFDRLVKNIEAGRGPIPVEQRDKILRAALDQLITYHVMKQEAAARGMSIADAEIDNQVQQMQKQFPSAAEFKKALDARNTSLEQLKADARDQMAINKLVEAEAATTVAATEPEAKEFYDKNPDKFKQVRASHILIMIKPDADEATKKAARAKTDDILKRIKGGEDFAKLARENSDDGSKEQGGDLGFFGQGRMVPEFEKAAFSLKPGEVSDVVTSQFGHHIIKVTEIKQTDFDTVKGQIVEYLSNQRKQERVNGLVEAAKKKAKIEVLV